MSKHGCGNFVIRKKRRWLNVAVSRVIIFTLKGFSNQEVESIIKTRQRFETVTIKIRQFL